SGEILLIHGNERKGCRLWSRWRRRGKAGLQGEESFTRISGMWFVKQRFLNFKDFFPGGIVLNGCFWPEAEDRALRGRNLSAVFRTLNRQVGKPWKGLPSCAPPGG